MRPLAAFPTQPAGAADGPRTVRHNRATCNDCKWTWDPTPKRYKETTGRRESFTAHAASSTDLAQHERQDQHQTWRDGRDVVSTGHTPFHMWRDTLRMLQPVSFGSRVGDAGVGEGNGHNRGSLDQLASLGSTPHTPYTV